MNIRIFWVRVMKCMCARTRPRFILSSERVSWGMEFEPMLTPREESPLPENFSRGGLNPQCCGQRAQTLSTSYSGPGWGFQGEWKAKHVSGVFLLISQLVKRKCGFVFEEFKLDILIPHLRQSALVTKNTSCCLSDIIKKLSCHMFGHLWTSFFRISMMKYLTKVGMC